MVKYIVMALITFVSSLGRDDAQVPAPPKISNVLSIALDGLRERDVVPSMTHLVNNLQRRGYQVYWYGAAQRCTTSISSNISLPAYATFLTGRTNHGVRGNHWNGRMGFQTLFDMYPGAQLFTSWGPLKGIMSGNKKTLKNGYLLTKGRYPAYEDQLVSEGFFNHYASPQFALVHFVDADNFAHLRMRQDYFTLLEKEITRTSDIIEYVSRTNEETAFVVFTDHGRGEGDLYHSHGPDIIGSENIWIMIASPVPIEISFTKCNHKELHHLVRRLLE